MGGDETIYRVNAQDRFRELASSYAAAMRRLCAVYARNQHDREDLFQNIFLAIWKALPAFRGDAAERTWVYSIAHNVAISWQTKERRWQLRRRDLDEGLRAEEPAGDRGMQLAALVSRLAPLDRQIVVLWLEGLTAAEIAQITGLRPGTVAVRLTRIRQSLSDTIRISEARNG